MTLKFKCRKCGAYQEHKVYDIPDAVRCRYCKATNRRFKVEA